MSLESLRRTRNSLVALGGILVVLVSCQQPEAPLPPTPDLAGVETILLALPTAWNDRDAGAWVESFAEDSGFTNILGMHFPDRVANRARHAELFATIFAESTLEAEILSVRRVGRRGAVATVEFRLRGYEGLPPGVEETEPGELRTRLITVLEHGDGGWIVLAAQNTAIHPAAVEALGPP